MATTRLRYNFSRPIFITGLCRLLFLICSIAATAAPLQLSSVEVWNGTANPHAAQGVTLSGSGTLSDPFTYTVPAGLHLSGAGGIRFSAAASFALRLAAGDLQLDLNSIMDLNKGGDRNAHYRFTLDLGGGDLLGAGQFITSDRGAHELCIINARNVTLQAINLRRNDASPADLTVEALGNFQVNGAIDLRDISTGGNAGGQATIRAAGILVHDILTGSARTSGGTANGLVSLTALAPPAYEALLAANNSLSNTITLAGVINTRGGVAGIPDGEVLAEAVHVTLAAGFSRQQDADRRFIIRAGVVQNGLTAANLFSDAASSGLSATHDVQWSTATLRVTACDPPSGGTFATLPTTATLTFSRPLNPATIAAGDLTFDGVAATGVALLSGDTVRFTLPMVANTIGTHSIQLAAGALSSTDALPNQPFGANYQRLAPPVIAQESITALDQYGVNLGFVVQHSPQVRACYGTRDGGPNTARWPQQQNLGTFADGARTTTLYGLQPGTHYYCRLLATNALGSAWSNSLLEFTTPPTTDPIDADTVALWLFDETNYPCTSLIDAGTGSYDLRLASAGQLVPGRFGNALHCAGLAEYNLYYSEWSSAVTIEAMLAPDGEPSGLWGPTIAPKMLLQTLATGQSWSCDFWLRLPSPPAADSVILDLGNAYEPGFTLGLASGATQFVLTNAYAGRRAICPTASSQLLDGAWHHVAFSWDAAAGALRHFVDGQLQTPPTPASIATQGMPSFTLPTSLLAPTDNAFDTSRNYELFRQHRFNLALAQDRHGSAPLALDLDELRFSRKARYATPFNAQRSHALRYAAVAPPPARPGDLPLLFGPDAPSGTVPLYSRKHVFIDDAIVAAQSGLTLTLNPATNPTQLSQGLSGDYSVIDRDGKIYFIVPDGYPSTLGYTRVFTSTDGLTIVAPNLGVTSYNGNTNNNIVLAYQPNYCNVIDDLNPAIPPTQRYKATAWLANRGIVLYSSPDLIHWRRNETLMLPVVSGGGAEPFWDDQRGDYQVYVKRDGYSALQCSRSAGRVSMGFEHTNMLAAWPFNKLVAPWFEMWAVPMLTCEGRLVFDVSGDGQVYRTRIVKYAWAPDVYLAFLWRFPADLRRRTELAVSRDGVHWTYTGKQGMYLDIGGTFNGATVFEAVSQFGLIRRGDELWQYAEYGMTDHNTAGADYSIRVSQRLDGFRSFDAGATTGTLLTRPLLVRGDHLELNVKATGAVRAALLDENGVAWPGYGLADCDPFQGDATAAVVRWHGSAQLPELAGRVMRLKLELANAKLFAFQFVEKKPADSAADGWQAMQ